MAVVRFGLPLETAQTWGRRLGLLGSHCLTRASENDQQRDQIHRSHFRPVYWEIANRLWYLASEGCAYCLEMSTGCYRLKSGHWGPRCELHDQHGIQLLIYASWVGICQGWHLICQRFPQECSSRSYSSLLYWRFGQVLRDLWTATQRQYPNQ